jgi:metal-responsive CopG/Arc/MetJ family transcriptional regulator
LVLTLYGIRMTAETDPPLRKSVTLPESLWQEVLEFRHGERISTEAEALRRLIQEGLRAEARKAKRA